MVERAAAAGAAIAEETRAGEIEGTHVHTNRGTVSAESVVLATDGYTDDLVRGRTARPTRPQPGGGDGLAPERYFETTTSARGRAYWQQTSDNRLVVGGWRDADLETEFTAEEAVTDPVQAEIEGFLAGILGSTPPITHRWAGILGLTPDHLPLVGDLPARPGIWTSLGYSGHGNVLALLCGRPSRRRCSAGTTRDSSRSVREGFRASTARVKRSSSMLQPVTTRTSGSETSSR